MNNPPPVTVMSLDQIEEMQQVLTIFRAEAAAAMYRTDHHERPYKAGRGEMYRLWCVLGQANEILELFKREQYPG